MISLADYLSFERERLLEEKKGKEILTICLTSIKEKLLDVLFTLEGPSRQLIFLGFLRFNQKEEIFDSQLREMNSKKKLLLSQVLPLFFDHLPNFVPEKEKKKNASFGYNSSYTSLDSSPSAS